MAIAQQTGLSDLLSRVLAGRGVGPEAAEKHLDPTLRALLPEPFSLTGMGEATERLVRAVENNETIAIFGDYDVDGACSSALLAEYLRLLRRAALRSIFPTASPKAMAPTARRSAPWRRVARPCW